MLEVRLREGLSLEPVGLDPGQMDIEELVQDGLVEGVGIPQRLVLTTRGRLLADMVTLRILEMLEQ